MRVCRVSIILIFAFLMLSSFVCRARAAEFRDGRWFLTARIVRDPRMPMPPREELLKSLEFAQKLIHERFLVDVTFTLAPGEISLDDLCSSLLDTTVLRVYPCSRENIFKTAGEDTDLYNFQSMLNGVKTDENCTSIFKDACASSRDLYLRFFPPAERKKLTGDRIIARRVISKFNRDRQAAKKLTALDGKPYFADGGHRFNLLRGWQYEILEMLSSGRAITKYGATDLVFTNVPIYLESPLGAPHVVMGQGVVHGTVGSINPNISVEDAYPASVATTFPTYELGVFLWNKSAAPPEKFEVLGDYVAHETGHQLFLIPDNSDPALEGCVMQRDYSTVDDAARLQLYGKRPPCREETLYARLALAGKLATNSDSAGAITIFDTLAKEYAGDNLALDAIAENMVRADLANHAVDIVRGLMNTSPSTDRMITYKYWLSLAEEK